MTNKFEVQIMHRYLGRITFQFSEILWWQIHSEKSHKILIHNQRMSYT